jgi:hypothetical protein
MTRERNVLKLRCCTTLLLGLGAGILTACSEDRAERAGQSVGNVSAKVGQTVEGLAAKTGRAVVTANDRAGRFFERAGERIQGKPGPATTPPTP